MKDDVWCVAWRAKPPDGTHFEWCATKGGRRPSKDATNDATMCGWTVVLRVGSGKRQPTCPDCKKAMR